MNIQKSGAFAVLALVIALVPTTGRTHDAPVPLPAASASSAANADEVGAKSAPLTADDGAMCLIQGLPPAEFKYVVVRKLKVKKGTYGAVIDILPNLAAQARMVGGTALVDYNGAQHFGFFPWRITRPIVSGTAIKWTGPAPDCTAAGGATLAAVMTANKEPNVINAREAAAAAAAASSARQ